MKKVVFKSESDNLPSKSTLDKAMAANPGLPIIIEVTDTGKQLIYTRRIVSLVDAEFEEIKEDENGQSNNS